MTPGSKTTFAPLAQGVSNVGGAEVISFTDYNGNLIAGGTFDTAGSVAAHQIAIWDGVNWSAFVKNTLGSVNSLANYNNELWNGSDIDTSNGSGYYVYPVQ